MRRFHRHGPGIPGAGHAGARRLAPLPGGRRSSIKELARRWYRAPTTRRPRRRAATVRWPTSGSRGRAALLPGRLPAGPPPHPAWTAARSAEACRPPSCRTDRTAGTICGSRRRAARGGVAQLVERRVVIPVARVRAPSLTPRQNRTTPCPQRQHPAARRPARPLPWTCHPPPSDSPPPRSPPWSGPGEGRPVPWSPSTWRASPRSTLRSVSSVTSDPGAWLRLTHSAPP